MIVSPDTCVHGPGLDHAHVDSSSWPPDPLCIPTHPHTCNRSCGWLRLVAMRTRRTWTGQTYGHKETRRTPGQEACCTVRSRSHRQRAPEQVRCSGRACNRSRHDWPLRPTIVQSRLRGRRPMIAKSQPQVHVAGRSLLLCHSGLSPARCTLITMRCESSRTCFVHASMHPCPRPQPSLPCAGAR